MGRARSLGSAQQSVCLSCHDGHLSCPQSVWKEFFSLMREEGRKGEGKGGEEERRWQGKGWEMEKEGEEWKRGERKRRRWRGEGV